ncbi:MAG TPA: metallopeptidase family protein [Rhizomicrobium sp.]|jgi:predicted Zn-dependent protease with MMP-like domain|nr:metallopeptidase family protein [Rhizomicrobium sp.]
MLQDCALRVAMGSGIMDWTNWEAPSLDDLEGLARSSFAELPAEFRALVDGIVFTVQDFPDEEVLRDLGLESEFEILGLFQGPDLADRTANRGSPEPTMVILYRRPILDCWAEGEETLGAIVRHVLVHEIGHHFGLSDEDMEGIEGEE